MIRMSINLFFVLICVVILSLHQGLSESDTTRGFFRSFFGTNKDSRTINTVNVVNIESSHEEAPKYRRRLSIPTGDPTGEPSSLPTGSPTTEPTSTPTSAPSQACTFCDDGEYYDGTDNECYDCTPGSYCPGQCSGIFSCDVGTYQPGIKQTSCTVCPTGHYQVLQGQAVCNPCPTGSECPSPNSSPSQCSEGYFASAESTSCTACPDGFYAATQGSGNCTYCPAGKYCATAADAPVDCPPGYYSSGGVGSMINCTVCPEGYRCPDATISPIACPAGYTAETGSSTCDACPAGRYCTNAFDSAGVECEDGYFSVGAADVCTPCPAGFECTSKEGDMSACASGWYSTEGVASCTRCDAGFFCAQTTVDVQVPCPLGFYSTGGAVACTECPAGYSCPYTTSSYATPCAAGTFSTGGQWVCTDCPAGFSCESTSTAVIEPCAPGTYSEAQDTSCTACPAGSYCATPASIPVQCPSGTYSEGSQTACTVCPAGSKCDGPGATDHTQCSVGYYSTGGATSCTLCTPGYMCPQGSTSPTPAGAECPKGGYCEVSTTFTPCPAGTYGFITGGRSEEHACHTCEEGYYCPTSGLTARQICPVGSYCPEGSSSLERCPQGTYNNIPGQVSEAACALCPAGRYCSGTGTSNPYLCPLGAYCPEGSITSTMCPEGTYSEGGGLYSVSQCQNCTAGYYCTGDYIMLSQYYGTYRTVRMPCAAGTYNPHVGAGDGSCKPCEAGYSCPTVGMSAMVYGCPVGHYCPAGTVDDEYPCPAGSYSDRTDITSADQCVDCPGGYTCPSGAYTGHVNTTACPEGYYCPTGTARGEHIPCPAGTYSYLTLLASASDCFSCPAGSYCLGGDTDVSGPCPEGYYCPMNTTYPQAFPCAAGTYSNTTELTAQDECTTCPAGAYCVEASTSAHQCPIGTYRATSSATSGSDCLACTAGYYCPTLQTVTPLECGIGYYSNTSADACTECPAGSYCGSTTTTEAAMRDNGASWDNNGDMEGSCFPGTYCPAGMSRAPTLLQDACPVGYYCPAGTANPIGCPAGTFGSTAGLEAEDDCTTTPKGYYTTANASAISGQCSPGYYCPAGSTSDKQTPCEAGFYRQDFGAGEQADCALCVAGGYCAGANEIPAVCPKGSYCPTGHSAPVPCPLGTYGNKTALSSVEGCTPCDGGHYCDQTGLDRPAGKCEAGFYCVSSSNSSRPAYSVDQGSDDDTIYPTGGLCPKGSYCPEGTTNPIECPAGTFNSNWGSTSAAACVDCTGGSYCNGQGLSSVTGACTEGYYCPVGSSSATQNGAQRGYYAPAGSSQELPCDTGFYNPNERQPTCLSCPAGYYCNTTAMISYTAFKCPTGHYCPAETAEPFKCPERFFTNVEGTQSLSGCLACTPGSYCAEYGLSEVSGPCDAGYYCSGEPAGTSNGGSDQASPVGQEFGSICPEGHYCPQGSKNPLKCPRGTYMNTTMNDGEVYFESNQYYCNLCPAGYACDAQALTTSDGTGLCRRGFWCTIGAPARSPVCEDASCVDMYGICPLGTYCPVGSTRPTNCSEGTYADSEGMAACETCPEGQFCAGAGTSTYEICPQGFFCPAGTGNDKKPCPVGKYGASPGLAAEDECTACMEGMYCDSQNLVEPAGYCEDGYMCPSGSQSMQGKTDAVETTPCPTGYYCIQGNVTACDQGQFCPEGSLYPRRCPLGTHQNNGAQGSCFDCPPGFYCDVNNNETGTITPLECPLGYYCPTNSTIATENPCPAGTFGNVTRLSDVLDCSWCTPGMYCESVATVVPDGLCTAGHFCGGNSTTPEPSSMMEDRFYLSYVGDTCVALSQYNETVAVNDVCPQGHYCPEGSSAPTPCPRGTNSSSTQKTSLEDCGKCMKGYYCPLAGTVKAERLCPEGYFCPSGTANPANNDSLLCPMGHECPEGSWEPTQCTPGYYSPNNGSAACTVCDAGHFCTEYALTSPTGSCVAGQYCPAGSNVAFICDLGYFQNVAEQASCHDCPAGSYCDVVNGTVSPLECPRGYYCPARSTAANTNFCPVGYYSNTTGLGSIDDCHVCPPGEYCDVAGMAEPAGSCSAGYFCGGGSSTSEPSSLPEERYYLSYLGDTCVAFNHTNTTVHVNDVCPPGHYCPRQSFAPIPCPPGTNSSSGMNTNLTSCGMCPKGYYCPLSGTVSAERLCPQGYFCPAGTANPFDVDALLCPAGSTCPLGSWEPLPCDVGKYGVSNGTNECLDCPAGYYCSLPGLSVLADCTVGHYCPNNTVSPIPCDPGFFQRDTRQSECDICTGGYYCQNYGMDEPTECGEGKKCPPGSTEPIVCALGEFQPNAKSSSCQLCNEGYYCENVDDLGNGNSTICPVGHYCPAGSAAPLQCAPGNYSDSLGAVMCDLCAPGYFCNAINGTSDPAPCPAGTECPLGSIAPSICSAGTYAPNPLTQLCDLCPPGMYCNHVNGTISPLECPEGTYCEKGSYNWTPCQRGYYNDDGGRGNCTACPPGSYCNDVNGTVTPTPCPVGQYCPVGSDWGTPCELGFYQFQEGQVDCLECPEGFRCNDVDGTYEPTICPERNFCPPGSANGTYCPDGTFGENWGKTNAENCTTCPEGVYCQKGIVVDDCAAGYFCRSGAATATPSVDISAYSASHWDKIEYLLSLSFGQCPPDFYCGNGTVNPSRCSNYTVRLDTGGATEDDCSLCPAGVMCLPSNHTWLPCPHGRYCPMGTLDDAPRCPVGTYNPSAGATSIDDCLPCPEGSWCRDTGIANYQTGAYECPSGHYCPTGTVFPLGCPGGTYRDIVGGASSEDCFPCITPQYCPYISSNNTYNCPPGYYCPTNNTMNATICTSGYFCPELTITPILCPPGFYCPQGSFQPTICYPGTYCPAGTGSANLCPAGMRATPEANFTAAVFSDLNSACSVCPEGTHGADPSRLSCPTCPAGFVCGENTTVEFPTDLASQNGYGCPVGHYCPSGSSEESPCPAGTHNPDPLSGSIGNCTDCAATTYQSLTGQAVCLPCSSSSNSYEGQSECTCTGKNRVFQAGNGWCICKPGYEFVQMKNGELELLSEDDGFQDCQPSVYDRCEEGNTVRSATTGKCVDDDDYCEEVCGPDGGTMSVTLGTCRCKNLETLAEACDDDCRSTKATMSCNADGEVVFTDPGSGDVLVLDPADMGSEGTIDCSVEGSSIISMSTVGGSFAGIFGPNEAVTQAADGARRRLSSVLTETEDVVAAEVELEPTTSDAKHMPWTIAGFAAMFLQDVEQRTRPSIVSTAPAVLSSIERKAIRREARAARRQRRRLSTYAMEELETPIVCISRGSSIVWDVDNDDYPIYIKDSLLNTNSNFDYTDFRKLADSCATSLDVTAFSFTFDEEGTYVFGLSRNGESITVIQVMLDDVACPTNLYTGGTPFVEFQNSHLSEMGVKSEKNLVMAPDWTLVVALLVGAFAMTFVVVGFLYFFRKSAWDSHAEIATSYRDRQRSAGTKIQGTKGGYFSALSVYREKHGHDPNGDDACACGGSVWRVCVPCRSAKVSASDDDVIPASIGMGRMTEGEDIEAAQAVSGPPDYDGDIGVGGGGGGGGGACSDVLKKLQFHDDKLESRMLDTTDMLKDLKQDLHKEVDELKQLLQRTVIDMGITPETRARRIKAIYDRIRADCTQRDNADIAFESAEGLCLELMEQVESLFNKHGPARIATEVVTELSSRIKTAIEKEEPDFTPSAKDSVGLAGMLKQLSDISDHILNKMEVANEDEIRRSDTVRKAIDDAIKTSNIEMPPSIVDALTRVRRTNAEVDDLHSITARALNQFRERVPRFVQEMQSGVAQLGSKLHGTMETGNDDMVAKERNHAASIMGTDFEDLNKAVGLMLDKLKRGSEEFKLGTTGESTLARQQASEERVTLLMLIDGLYSEEGGFANGMTEDQMKLLMERLQGDEGSLSPRSPRDTSVPGSPRPLSPRQDPSHDMDKQNEAIDGATLDTAMEAQRRQLEVQKDALKAGAKNEEKDEESQGDVDARKSAEQLALNQKLERERQRKLDALLRQDIDIDSLTVVEQRAVSLSSASHALALRLCAVRARSTFSHLDAQLRLDLATLLKDFVRSCVDRDVEDELERRVLARVDAQSKLVADAHATLMATREGVERQEAERRNVWMASAEAIDMDVERARLLQLKEEGVSAAEKANNDTIALLEKCGDIDAKTTTSQVEMQIESFATPSLSRTLRQSAKNQASSHKRRAQQYAGAAATLLSSDRLYLDQIISFVDSWSSDLHDAERQQNLGRRMALASESSTQLHSRLRLLEHDLQAEASEARLMADLTSRRATITEVETAIRNHEEATHERALVLASRLREKGNEERKRLTEEQEKAVVDYEREFCLSMESLAMQTSTEIINTIRCRTETMRITLEALRHKEEAMMANITIQRLPQHVVDKAHDQIRAETFREEHELRAAIHAYQALHAAYSTHTLGMVQGVVVNTDAVRFEVNHEFEAESALLKSAYAMDVRRIRNKYYVLEFVARENEAQRLSASQRPPDVIAKMLEDLYAPDMGETVEKAIAPALVKAERDHATIQEQLSSSSSSRIEVEDRYDTGASAAQAEYQSKVTAVHDSRASRSISDDTEELLQKVRRRECSELISALTALEEQLVPCYKEVMNKHLTVHNVDEELRKIINRKQQGIEAKESSWHSAKQREIERLNESQRAKRDAAMMKRMENEAALDGLNKVMERKREAYNATLEKRRLARRMARQRELVTIGLNEDEAITRAVEELEDFEGMEDDEFESSIQAEEQRLSEEPLTDSLSAIKDRHRMTLDALSEGFQASQKKQRDLLAQRLADRRKAKAAELRRSSNMSMSEEEADRKASAALKGTDVADKEALENKLVAENDSLTSLLSAENSEEKARIEKAFKQGALSEEDYRDELDRIDANERLSSAILKQGMDATKAKLKTNLAKRRKKLRDRHLDEAKTANPDADLTSLEEDAEREADAEIERQSNMLEKDLEQAQKRLEALAHATAEEQAAAARLEHELRLKGLEAGQEVAKKNKKASLIRRLQRRKQIVRNSLCAKGRNPDEVENILSKTYGDDEANLEQEAEKAAEEDLATLLEHKRAERQGALDLWDEHAKTMALQEDEDNARIASDMDNHVAEMYGIEEDSATKAVAAARGAVSKTLDDSDAALRAIKEAHEANFVKMRDAMAAKRKADEAAFRKRLQEKRSKRVKALLGEGMAQDEAESQADKEMAAELEDGLESLRVSGLAEENTAAYELNAALQKEEASALSNMYDAASRDKVHADAQRDAAQARLNAIKRENEEKAKALHDDISTKRKSRENKLQARLRERREKAMKNLEAEGASAETKESALAELEADAEKERQALVEQEDEADRVAETAARDQAMKAEAKAAAVLAEEDVQAAAAAAKLAALKTAQELESALDEDAHQKQLEKLRKRHEEHAAKATERAAADKKKKKTKLEDRLAAKRALKEKELREAETKERDDLEAKYAREAEEKELLKKGRDEWMEALRSAMSEADDKGFRGLDKEDYVLKSTLGRKLVPDQQLSECVEAIMLDRHTDDTAALLDAHYQDRLAKIRPAIETLLEEKSSGRKLVLAELEESNADETTMKNLLMKFDDEYSARQRAIEHEVTAAMESQHTKEQMELKQRQLRDVSRAIMMYTKGDGADEAAAASQEKLAEEMAAYRENLEKDRIEREKKLTQEREEAELKLRQQHEEAMTRMQEALEADMKRQKEAAKKRMAEDSREEHKERKSQLLEDFAREADAAKNKMHADKAKSKERLQRMRAKKRATIIAKKKEAEVALPLRPSEVIAEGNESEEDDNDNGGDGTPSADLARVGSQNAIKAAARRAKMQQRASAEASLDPETIEKLDTLTASLEAITKRLAQIEGLGAVGQPAAAAAAAATPPTTSDASAGAPGAGSSYVDEKPPEVGHELSTLNDSEVALQEKSRLEYGALLASMVGLSRVKLVIARSLPAIPADMAGNSFAASYRFDASKETLYIHEDKMTNSGDFGLVVIHALSHIKTNGGDMSDDTNPAFTGEFYRNMKILSKDLYKRSVMQSDSGGRGSPSPLTRGDSIGTAKGGNNASDRRLRRRSSAGLSQSEIMSPSSFAGSGAMAPEGFDMASVHSRMQKYAVEGGLPSDFFDRYNNDPTKGTPLQLSAHATDAGVVNLTVNTTVD